LGPVPDGHVFPEQHRQGEVGQPQHQWVFDNLAAAANNKQIQGDAFTYATAVTASRVSNYTQIARKAITVSETLRLPRPSAETRPAAK
jgi:hypothetical protein